MKMEKRITESELKSQVFSITEKSKQFKELAPIINWVLIRTVQEYFKDSIFDFNDDEYYFIGFDFDFEMKKFIMIFECETENPELETKKYFEFPML